LNDDASVTPEEENRRKKTKTKSNELMNDVVIEKLEKKNERNVNIIVIISTIFFQ